MKAEYDDRVEEYIPLKNGKYSVDVKSHDGVYENGVIDYFNSDV